MDDTCYSDSSRGAVSHTFSTWVTLDQPGFPCKAVDSQGWIDESW